MSRMSQYRWWNHLLALCLCAGLLLVASISSADAGRVEGEDSDDALSRDGSPGPIGTGDPDIPQTKTGTKPGAGSGRSGAGIYRNSAPIESVEWTGNVWMMRFHAASRLWAAYFVRH